MKDEIMKRIALALFALIAFGASAIAQTVTNPVVGWLNYGAYNSSPPTCSSGLGCMLQTDVNGNLLVAGSFSATLSGFTPNGNYGTLTATAATSASTALPAGAVVAFQNTSTIDVSCVLTAGASTATTNKIVVRGGATMFLTVGSNTTAACINQTGSASNVVVMAGGAGLGSNYGGSSGGGGGGAATIADGADVAEGITTDAAVAAGASGTVSAKLRAISRDVGTVATNTGLPLPTQAITVPVGGFGLIDSNSNTVLNDPCATAVKAYTAINVVTATNVIIAGVASKKKYICGIFLYPAGTTNIAVYQATTGTSCATAQTDIFGGHTTATGFVATAQAGFVVGNGASSMAATTTNQTDICITTSAAIQVSGAVVTVDR